MTRFLDGSDLRSLLDVPAREIAVLDVRSPQARAERHIAVSTGLPLHELELRIAALVPSQTTPLVLASDPDLDLWAERILVGLGYTDVAVLADGLAGWIAAGGRLYTGTNVRSKTLGEWIEKRFSTATVDAETVAGWRTDGEDVVVLDSRPHTEYLHHHIPGGYDTGGGAELAYRGLQVVTNPRTKIVVNCAGRTRGIVGAQSIINTGIANPVYSLHNGTPAWGWSGQRIEHGAGATLGNPDTVSDDLRKWAARTLDEAGAETLDGDTLAAWQRDLARTTYVIDVRTPEEFSAGSLPGARHVQGGQLVQAGDEHLAVRGARVVLVDDGDLIRAASTVQWLRYLHDGQLAVIEATSELVATPHGIEVALPDIPAVDPDELAREIGSDFPPVIFDLRTSTEYESGHLPGSIHARREHLVDAVAAGTRVVLVGNDSALQHQGSHDLQAGSHGYRPHFAARDLLDRGYDVRVLQGGPDSVAVPLTTDDPQYAGEVADRTGPPPFGPERDAWYREYFDWEYSLLPDSAGDPDFDFDGKTP